MGIRKSNSVNSDAIAANHQLAAAIQIAPVRRRVAR